MWELWAFTLKRVKLMSECQTNSAQVWHSGLPTFPLFSILQPKVIFFVYFQTLWPFFSFKQKGIFMFSPFAVSCPNFCVAFIQSCKGFLHNEVTWAITQMPWNHDFVTSNLFLYLLNVFMQHHWYKYYCTSKALFSPQRSPPQSVLAHDSKCFQRTPAFTIWYSASSDDGKWCNNTGVNRRLWSG